MLFKYHLKLLLLVQKEILTLIRGKLTQRNEPDNVTAQTHHHAHNKLWQTVLKLCLDEEFSVHYKNLKEGLSDWISKNISISQNKALFKNRQHRETSMFY